MRFAAVILLAWSVTSDAVEYSIVPGAGGIPLQVAEAGPESAPAILFLHGATLSSSSWMQQFESQLADRFHLVAFDLRGHGNSGKPWDADSYSDSKLWADDVAAVIEATGLDKPVFVAWSFGGHVTMDFLRHFGPSRIAGIVFVGSTGGMLPFPPPDAETAERYARLGRLAMSPDAGDRLEAARDFVDGMIEAPVPQAAVDREVAAVLAITPYARAAMQGRSLDNSDLVGRLTMPVLFMIGDADRAATPAGITQLVGKMPDARLSVYADTGHMPFIERRERFDREVEQFVVETLERQQ